jgi:septum formation protein
MEIILASASPRRKELLGRILKEFKVIPADIDEYNILSQDEPSKIAKELALKKAEEVAKRYPQALVIGADTVVEMGGRLYGKPKNNDESVKMLKEFKGTVQNVITGLAVLHKSLGISLVGSELTRVKMRENITDEEIKNYVKSRAGENTAGGYDMKKENDEFVEWFKGDYYNVVGLPLGKLYKMLKEIKERWNLKIDLRYNEMSN